MTGMVFAKTRGGLAAFRRLNGLMMVALLALQALVCMHPFDAFMFGHLLNLDPHLSEIARRTLFFSIVMQAAFFLSRHNKRHLRRGAFRYLNSQVSF